MIRPARSSDAKSIADIYSHYVVTSTITFEEQPVSAEQMAERISEIASASLPWLVAESSGHVVGYAYASKWKARSAYRFSVEITVYVEKNALGQGWGGKLYEELFAALKALNVHVVIGGVALPNHNSIALHEKFNLKKVAHFEQVGLKFGQWIDVGYWQKVL